MVDMSHMVQASNLLKSITNLISKHIIIFISLLFCCINSYKILSYSKLLSKHSSSPIEDSIKHGNDHDRETVIILHGLLGSSRNLKSWANLLHEKLNYNFDIICCDLRNHGKSSSTLGSLDMNYNLMASDVLGTMNSLGIKKAHIIGHSMGGKVAAAAALQYTRLKCFSSVTMMDISPIHYSNDDFNSVIQTVITLKDINDHYQYTKCKETLHQQINLQFPDQSLRQFIMSNLQLKGDTLHWGFNLDDIYRGLDTIAEFPYHSDKLIDDDKYCHPYKNPTLILKGSKSSFVRSSHMSRLSSLFPLYNIASVKDAGHWLHHDQPEDTTSIVSNFIRSAISYNSIHSKESSLSNVA